MPNQAYKDVCTASSERKALLQSRFQQHAEKLRQTAFILNRSDSKGGWMIQTRRKPIHGGSLPPSMAVEGQYHPPLETRTYNMPYSSSSNMVYRVKMRDRKEIT